MPLNQIYRGRRAATIENEGIRVTVLAEGGHIAEVLDKQTGVNPLWTPPFGHAVPNWDFPIAEEPGPGQYRYLQFAWKATSEQTTGSGSMAAAGLVQFESRGVLRPSVPRPTRPAPAPRAERRGLATHRGRRDNRTPAMPLTSSPENRPIGMSHAAGSATK